ncbi:AraC family transcriptional regulator [Mucilaginibacter sp.]|jgi:AraC-like DNA-binding protein|uniref:AraC family transcriptional regulator n=1 Tax=Mucilaginibacter sp. TaxID=1882438 RepID=UPI002BEF537D|nr:AraC family transcriptional regulator [Mucilaginibacter sp.]HTI60930.1 AraC family transcriptional regulator [Mucilaginibacter sp.]
MYFKSLPDHTAPGFDEQLHFSKFKKHNIIFNALSSKSSCDDHVGCLSLKTVLSGEEWYGVNKRRLAVRPGQFLILNNDQNYSCNIDTTEKVRVLSIFFKKEFAASVFSDALVGEAASLDDPFNTSGSAPEFFQTLNPIDAPLQQRLSCLVADLETQGYDDWVVDEQLVFVMRQLLATHKMELKLAGRVDAVKTHTKTEIHKRLCIARDLLRSSFTEELNLQAVSSEACLSVPQLVRQFKAVFQTTPHQYLTRIRLAHATDLLKRTPLPVHEITWMCGFEDTSAFCRAFKTAFGVQPLAFRAAC